MSGWVQVLSQTMTSGQCHLRDAFGPKSLRIFCLRRKCCSKVLICVIVVARHRRLAKVTMAAAAAPAAGHMQQPSLTYWDRNPPYAAIALAQEAGVELQHAACPKATKETIAKLEFANGCVAEHI
jgi:hypothetical protein